MARKSYPLHAIVFTASNEVSTKEETLDLEDPATGLPLTLAKLTHISGPAKNLPVHVNALRSETKVDAVLTSERVDTHEAAAALNTGKGKPMPVLKFIRKIDKNSFFSKDGEAVEVVAASGLSAKAPFAAGLHAAMVNADFTSRFPLALKLEVLSQFQGIPAEKREFVKDEYGKQLKDFENHLQYDYIPERELDPPKQDPKHFTDNLTNVDFQGNK